jgi:DNA-binding response OmpR family regulator
LALLGIQQFDLLITDLDLPQLSGVELIRILRSRPQRPPILVASGTELSRDVAALVERMLIKPFQLSELQVSITELLST